MFLKIAKKYHLLMCISIFYKGVVGIFLVFSFTVYTSVVGNIFGGEFAVLREALPFFCLLSDFVTVGDLAKFALSAASYVSISLTPPPPPVSDAAMVAINTMHHAITF